MLPSITAFLQGSWDHRVCLSRIVTDSMSRLAITVLFTCASATSSGCAALGDEMACAPNSQGENCRVDRRGAREAHQKAALLCDNGDARACYSAAKPPHRPIIVSRLEYACTHGIGGACFDLAEVHQRKRTKSDAEVSALLKQSCSLGSSIGCLRLARRSTSSDQLALWVRACELKSGEGCFQAAQLHLQNTPTEEGLKNGKALLVSGCALKHRGACEALGRLESR